MKKIGLCLATVMLLMGMNGCKDRAGSEGPLPVLDFRADIQDQEVALQDLGKVRYFRLHTPGDVLLGIRVPASRAQRRQEHHPSGWQQSRRRI